MVFLDKKIELWAKELNLGLVCWYGTLHSPLNHGCSFGGSVDLRIAASSKGVAGSSPPPGFVVFRAKFLQKKKSKFHRKIFRKILNFSSALRCGTGGESGAERGQTRTAQNPGHGRGDCAGGAGHQNVQGGHPGGLKNFGNFFENFI